MQLIHFTIPARFACVAALAIAGGACAPSDPGSATGGRSGATGGVGMAGTGGSTNVGTGGDAAGTGGADAMGGSGTGGSDTSGTGGSDTSGTGGGGTATGGSDASGGAGGRGQSTGGAAGGATTGGGCGAAAFCDDFERTMLGADWMNENAANMIAIDTAQHHSGMSSVHIQYGTGGVNAFVASGKGYPFPNDSFWGRVWLYAKTTAEINHHVYIDLANSAQKGVSPNPSVRILNTQKMSFIATNTLGDKNGTSAVPLPQEKWSCFEWHIAAMMGKGTVELYLDGTVVPGTTQMNVSIPNVNTTRLGLQRFAPGVAAELWYDDYAVGAARIGCN